jgi:hypothetical protein
MTLIWGRGSKGPLRKWRGGKEDHFADPAETLGRLMRYATLYCHGFRGCFVPCVALYRIERSTNE